MITWMQKHKKYLIVTVWISSIAFIAATMVGWGAYNFSSSASNVAKVGNIDISINDFQRQYQDIYNRYNEQYKKVLNQNLDEEQAKKMGLENEALQILIDRALLENFAIDSGIRISNEDIAIELQSFDIFKENGKFSRERYEEFLRQSRMRAADFENLIKKDLFIKKIIDSLPSMLTPLEQELFTLPNRLEDRISIEIINNVRLNITNDDLQKYYNENKDNYKKDREFEVEIIETKIENKEIVESELVAYYDVNKSNYTKDGEILDFNNIKDEVKKDYQKREAQKDALKTYNDFKANKINGDKITISEVDINNEILNALNTAKEGDIIKPMFNGDKFVTIKILKKLPQQTKSFDEVKNILKLDYEKTAKQDAIKKEAESKLNVFKGQDIGFISIDKTRQIKNLNEFEVQQLLNKIFTSDSRNGYLLLPNKAILYKITEQRIVNKKIDNKELEVFKNIKYNLMERAILDFLSKEYKIINNLKKDS